MVGQYSLAKRVDICFTHDKMMITTASVHWLFIILPDCTWLPYHWYPWRKMGEWHLTSNCQGDTDWPTRAVYIYCYYSRNIKRKPLRQSLPETELTWVSAGPLFQVTLSHWRHLHGNRLNNLLKQLQIIKICQTSCSQRGTVSLYTQTKICKPASSLNIICILSDSCRRQWLGAIKLSKRFYKRCM